LAGLHWSLLFEQEEVIIVTRPKNLAPVSGKCSLNPWSPRVAKRAKARFPPKKPQSGDFAYGVGKAVSAVLPALFPDDPPRFHAGRGLMVAL
jgi:hypothetical protein